MKLIAVMILAACMAAHGQNVTPSDFAPLGRIGMGVWSPLRLGDKLAAWFDADDPATVLDANGNPATSGAEVQEWRDKSGNNRHAAALDPGKRPTRQAGVQNGRAVLRTDGDDRLDLASAGGVFQDKSNGHVFAVMKDANQAGGNAFHTMFFAQAETGGARVAIYSRFSGGDGWRGGFRRLDSDGIVSANAGLAEGHVVFSIAANWAGGTASAQLGSATPVVVSLASSGKTSDTGSTLFSLFGSTATSQNPPANSEIAEVIVVNEAMTAAEIAAVQKYLKQKWGTP